MKKQKIHRPVGLMAKLAKTLNVSLIWLQWAEKISPNAVRRMQDRCSGCCDPKRCDRLIGYAEGDMTEPPEFCPNRKLFLGLKKGG